MLLKGVFEVVKDMGVDFEWVLIFYLLFKCSNLSGLCFGFVVGGFESIKCIK